MTSAKPIDAGLPRRAAQALAALADAARHAGEIALRDFASGARTRGDDRIQSTAARR